MELLDIVRFQELIGSLVDSKRVKPYRIAKCTDRDKSVVGRWQNGKWRDTGAPPTGTDIARVLRCALEERIDITPFQTFTPIWSLGPAASYEERMAADPPDFSGFHDAEPPPPHRVSFCNMDLDTVIGIGSSPLTGSAKWTQCMLDLFFGLSTFKTQRTVVKPSWDPPQIAFVVDPPALLDYDPTNPPEVLVVRARRGISTSVPNIVNSMGVPCVPEWKAEYERLKTHPRGRFVGISVVGDGVSATDVQDDYVNAVTAALALHPPFVEINLWCPNLERNDLFLQNPEFLAQICRRAQAVTSRRGVALIAKLPPLSEHRLKATLAKIGRHIDAVTLNNTVKVRPVAVDRDGNRYPVFPNRQFGGLSGPVTFPLTRRSVSAAHQVRRESKFDFRIIAVGGITNPGHVIELMQEGADLVQVCTAAIFDPLLAWKTAFHLCCMPGDGLRSGDSMRWPRDGYESKAYRALEAAVAECTARGRPITHELFKSAWNEWMDDRSALYDRRVSARRVPQPPTIDYWIGILNRPGAR